MPTICHVIVIHVCFVKKQEPFRFFSLARFLKLKIAARQQCIEICNARRYWSMLVVYCVDIRLKVVFFYCDACHCFTVILMLFYCVFFIVYWSVIFYECICFYLTVSESDIIKLFNHSIYFAKGFQWIHMKHWSSLETLLDLCSKWGPGGHIWESFWPRIRPTEIGQNLGFSLFCKQIFYWIHMKFVVKLTENTLRRVLIIVPHDHILGPFLPRLGPK